jgi:NIMA-interacting peptidyl-prolyl cis-trans isomerase 1
MKHIGRTFSQVTTHLHIFLLLFLFSQPLQPLPVVSRRTGQSVTLSYNQALSELKEYEAKIQLEAPGNDLGTIFSHCAKQRSDCSSFKSGGELGFFGHGQMQRPFEEASFALQPNQMSGIVSTDSGLHLIFRIA